MRRRVLRTGLLALPRGRSPDEPARRSGVSRSTLSCAERAAIGPTASLLGRLCAVYGRTVSQLLSEVEADPAHLIRAAEQTVWTDERSGFVRRSAAPSHRRSPDCGRR
ncbi:MULTISPECIES: helix-turn-helix domain-containing protein [unclassified Streptomyces]|uniref:helix-turn-helix domain-containing protein n=1 Tax=unclassified Streptomyces TaxID=2593676 RepID=UPI00382AD908